MIGCMSYTCVGLVNQTPTSGRRSAPPTTHITLFAEYQIGLDITAEFASLL